MSQSTTSPSVTGATALRALRIAAGIGSVLVIVQATFAGQMLSTNPDMVAMHEWGGYLLFVLSVIITVAAVMAGRRRQAPRWVVGLGAATVVLVGLQMYAGYGEMRVLHVPLGVSLLGVMLLLALSAQITIRR